MPKAVPIEPDPLGAATENSTRVASSPDEIAIDTPNALADSLAAPSDNIEPTTDEAVAEPSSPQEPVTVIDRRDYQTTPYATFDFAALQAALAPPPAPGLTPPSIIAEFPSSGDRATPTPR